MVHIFQQTQRRSTTKQKLSAFRDPTQLLVKLGKVHPHRKHNMHFANFVPENIWHLQLTATVRERLNFPVVLLKRNYVAQPDVTVIEKRILF